MSLGHPHIVSGLGAMVRPQEPLSLTPTCEVDALVMEYMPHGTMHHLFSRRNYPPQTVLCERQRYASLLHPSRYRYAMPHIMQTHLS